MRKPRAAGTALGALIALVVAGNTGFPRPGRPGGGEPAAGARQPVRRALLIGINRFQKWPWLGGCVNDVEVMARILEVRYGFDRRNLRLLKDEQATRQAMLAALNRLVDEAGPDDVVYFHFSGHGSQVKDLNRDEPDGMDEALVPYDGGAAGVPFIIDDELDQILARLRTPHCVLVLDACHSGTATRAVGARVRRVPPDRREALYRNLVGSRKAVPTQERYLLLTGAAAHQEALDLPCEGEARGLFSYALSRALGSAPRNASVDTVWRLVETEMRRFKARVGSRMPEPQLEYPARGDRRAQALFPPPAPGGGGRSYARFPWLEVRARPGGRRGTADVALADGAVLGAAVGSVWDIFPRGDDELHRPLTSVKVTAHLRRDALATVIGPAAKASLERSRAVLRAPAAARPKLPVALREHAGRSREFLAALRANLPEVEIVPEEKARFAVERAGPGWKIYGLLGKPVISIPEPDPGLAGKKASAFLSRALTTAELMTLDNPSADLRLEVRMLGGLRGAARKGLRESDAATEVMDLSTRRYRAQKHKTEPRSAENTAGLEVKASADCYLTIVDVDARGLVQVLFPVKRSAARFPEGKIPGDEVVALPGSYDAPWDVIPPPGRDTLRIFATRDRETAELIRAHLRQAQETAAVVGARATKRLRPLRELRDRLVRRGLVEADAGTPAGGPETPAPPRASWTAVSLGFEIVE